ncbi:YopX family protein [Bacillus thuringiensis]|nr:YopX family protein [Bacillus thuringiensis]
MKKNKFRAWHKEMKCWISLHNKGYSFNPNNGQIYYEGLNITSHIDLMQYTGLKDKNGKEIYEGYISKFSGNVVALGIVKYNENSATYQAYNGNSGWLFGNESRTNIEILGNIYENPEFVKKLNKNFILSKSRCIKLLRQTIY